MQTGQPETINVFTVNNERFALIIGKGKHIICETDFCHSVEITEETAEFLANKEQAAPVRVCDFGHYWGIKNRVERNYKALLESMREIGADVSTMPKWPAREEVREMAAKRQATAAGK